MHHLTSSEDGVEEFLYGEEINMCLLPEENNNNHGL
jgi:hypothetical protein